MQRISIVIPSYNESATIAPLVYRVMSVSLPLEKEVIIIDDGSTDNTWEIVQRLRREIPNLKLLRNPSNMGKGYCLRKVLQHASGQIFLTQDADLEYDPRDYKQLVQPLLDGVADVVFGSRFITSLPHRVLYFHHYLANQLLTFLTNIVTGLNLSDMETGYKAFRTDVLRSLKLCENRFGIEAEVALKAAWRPNTRIYEVGISYHGRTYEEGKKIRWYDGLYTVWVIVKYSLLFLFQGRRSMLAETGNIGFD